MKFITITGIDKSGKSTLIEAYMNDTNYENYVVDRDPSTYFFFNYIQKRLKLNSVKEYSKFIYKFKESIDLAVLLYCNEEDLDNRFKEHNEPKLVGDLDAKEHMRLLEFFFDSACYNNTVKINTSNFTVEECVEIIKKELCSTNEKR